MEIPVIFAPLLGLMIGGGVLGLVGYTNWHKGANMTIIGWIGRVVYRNGERSELHAQSLFGIVTAVLVMVSGSTIIASLYILTLI
jgi:hypothetical protein